MEHSYYVYSLKDTRKTPAVPFYIGKGTGTRAFDHLVKPDSSRKGKLIKEIIESGAEVLVTIMVDELSEIQAIRLEAELISAFGTIDNGGLLTNSVIPKGEVKTPRKMLVLPTGTLEKAQLGLELLKSAVMELARANPEGITNAQTASYLRLKSDYGGGSRDYLSYSLLGQLMREGKIERVKNSKKHIARVK